MGRYLKSPPTLVHSELLSIGLFFNNAQWYIIAVVILLLALTRKYFLMNRLKG